MAGTGGRRRGAGRPKGTGNKELQAVRDALRENRDALVRRALRLALAKKPNIPVLLKLLDKVAPSMHTSEVSGMLGLPPIKVMRDNIA